ncbi:hypothetical protein HIR68_09060 [Staphylococcus coagulans]|nr:hypothetical protein [Staphylococcus coagulans]
MMKIKTKKEMKLPELIEWAWDNDVKNRSFTGTCGGEVDFDRAGFCYSDLIEPDETFTIEVEEEITKDTVIPRLIDVWESKDGRIVVSQYDDESVDNILELTKRVNGKSLSIHALNDDMTMTLLCKRGETVE